MNMDPKERLGSTGVEKIKQHPFFKGKYILNVNQ